MNAKKLLAASLLVALFFPSMAFAVEGGAQLYLPLGTALAIGLAALGGTLGQGKAIAASVDAMGRNPSAAGPIRIAMILGLVFVESLVIFSFVIAFLLQGKI
jgi:F-type H+-transporting ATPase subunit c